MAKTTSRATPRATSSATRRRAACSSARRLLSLRALARGDRVARDRGELREPFLRAGPQRPVPCDRGQHAPQPVVAADRRRGGVVLDHGRPARLEDTVHEAVLVGGPRHADRRPRAIATATEAPSTPNCHSVVTSRASRLDASGDDRVEHLRLRAAARRDLGDPAQSRLLVGELLEIEPCLGVGERDADQLGELRDARPRVGRERLGASRGGEARSPHPAADRDRDADREPDAALARLFDERASLRHLRRSEPVRAGAVAHRPQHVVDRPALADRERAVHCAPRGEQRDRVVGLEAHQGRGLGADDPRDLLVDRVEDVLLGRAARDQRRHAVQRGLLAGLRGRRVDDLAHPTIFHPGPRGDKPSARSGSRAR